MQSTYGSDYSSKQRKKPIKQLPLRPTSITRRNNPHPQKDFPDTQVLRKLNKESTEIEKIAQANEAAMSKKTFVDDMLQQNDVSGSSRVDPNAKLKEVIANVLSDVDLMKLQRQSLEENRSEKGRPVYGGYVLNMEDHFY